MPIELNRPIIQVALDMMDLRKALRAAVQCGTANWIEVGTPLIKNNGMDAVRQVAGAVTQPVVADLKIADLGAEEAEMAIEAGAKIVTVLGGAQDETIRSAFEACKKHGCYLVADFIDVRDHVTRAQQVRDMVDGILVHTAVDKGKFAGLEMLQAIGQKMQGPRSGNNVIQSLVERFGKPTRSAQRQQAPVFKGPVLGAAGGIDDKSVSQVVSSGAKIIVVGRYITGAEDPLERISVLKARMGI